MKDIQGQKEIIVRHQSVKENERLKKLTVPILNHDFNTAPLADCTMIKNHRPLMKNKTNTMIVKKKMVSQFYHGRQKISRIKKKCYSIASSRSKLMHYGLIFILAVVFILKVETSENQNNEDNIDMSSKEIKGIKEGDYFFMYLEEGQDFLGNFGGEIKSGKISDNQFVLEEIIEDNQKRNLNFVFKFNAETNIPTLEVNDDEKTNFIVLNGKIIEDDKHLILYQFTIDDIKIQSPELINSLTVNTIFLLSPKKNKSEKDKLEKDKREINNCVVCFECVEPNNTLTTTKLECNHFFHKECILKWLENNNCCPLCRYKIIDKENTVNQGVTVNMGTTNEVTAPIDTTNTVTIPIDTTNTVTVPIDTTNTVTAPIDTTNTVAERRKKFLIQIMNLIHLLIFGMYFIMIILLGQNLIYPPLCFTIISISSGASLIFNVSLYRASKNIKYGFIFLIKALTLFISYGLIKSIPNINKMNPSVSYNGLGLFVFMMFLELISLCLLHPKIK